MEIFTKILRGIAVAIHSLLVTAVLVVLAASVTLQGAALLQDTDTPLVFGRHFCPVTSDTMAPVLPKGTLAIITPQEETYATGDIVAVVAEDAPWFGRVMLRGAGGYMLGNAGASAALDGMVQHQRTLGLVTGQLSWAGTVLAWATTTTGTLILIAAGLVLADLPKWVSGKYDDEDFEEEDDWDEDDE